VQELELELELELVPQHPQLPPPQQLLQPGMLT
jgi:hypothetical protein